MKSLIVFCFTILFASAGDIFLKWVVFEKYKDSGHTTLIPNFLGIMCSRNEGIAFGLFPSKSNVLVYLTLIAVVLIVWLYYRSDKEDTLNTLGLAFIISGAVGNLWDRIVFHSVRDFIDLHAGNFHWPTFNVADVLICTGVGLVILKNKNKEKKIHHKPVENDP